VLKLRRDERGMSFLKEMNTREEENRAGAGYEKGASCIDSREERIR